MKIYDIKNNEIITFDKTSPIKESIEEILKDPNRLYYKMFIQFEDEDEFKFLKNIYKNSHLPLNYIITTNEKHIILAKQKIGKISQAIENINAPAPYGNLLPTDIFIYFAPLRNDKKFVFEDKDAEDFLKNYKNKEPYYIITTLAKKHFITETGSLIAHLKNVEMYFRKELISFTLNPNAKKIYLVGMTTLKILKRYDFRNLIDFLLKNKKEKLIINQINF